MTEIEKRLASISDLFISPDMKNLGMIEKQIGLIWEANGEKLTESPVRVGQTNERFYKNRVVASTIPQETTPFHALVQELVFFFNGMIKWNSPDVMININPSPLISAIAASACASVFNPNLAMDVPAGNLAYAELETVKMICDLVGWDIEESAGVMTFGGKGTLLYAIRAGLHACCPEAREKGLKAENVKVFSTEQGHPCHYEDCEWLGIGRENCIRVPVLDNGQVNLTDLRHRLEAAVAEGAKIACILLNGGSTLYTTVDDIEQVVQMRDELVKKYSLSYFPHIHVDSVIGWAWLMFDTYNFERNPLGFSEDALAELRYVYEQIKKVRLADSFAVDFHKTGYSPYLCSMFVCRDQRKLYNLGEAKQAPLSQLEYGIYAPFTYTLELTRAGVSALEAWISLKQLGRSGYQRVIGTLVETGCHLRKHFQSASYSVCRNNEAHGFVAMAMLFPEEYRARCKNDLNDFSDEELLRIAQYNHRFYLYILSLNVTKKPPFLFDFVSKQASVRSIHLGTIKLYPMSPFCNLDYLDSFYRKFEEVLREYDAKWEEMDLEDSPYRPKPFVAK